MIWADHAGLWIWIACLALLAMHLGMVYASGSAPEPDFDLGGLLAAATFLVALPVWLVLRVMDFVLGAQLQRWQPRE